MMFAPKTKRVAYEGVGFGVIAGVIFLAVEMFDSAVRSGMPAAPLRKAASIVMGVHALDSSLAATLLVGIAVHLVLSGIFGLGYAELEVRLPSEARRRYDVQLATGIFYAALLWLVGYQLVAARLMPWFVTGTPLGHLVLQAIFFGGPLGLMFAAAERRTPQIIKPAVG